MVFNCAIICYHAHMWKVAFLTNNTDPSFQYFAHHNPVSILSNQGTSWVDVFFLLNSCLLVYNLLPRLQSVVGMKTNTTWRILLDFYHKKSFTIIPIYTSSTLMVWLVSILMHSSYGSSLYASQAGMISGFVGGCPDRIWKNVLLMNNWGPDIGCGGINWTMAPTIQCYLLAPLLLVLCRPWAKAGFVTRILALCAFIFTCGLCINIYFSIANDIRYPMCVYFYFWDQGLAHFGVYAEKYYIRSLPRIPVLVVGALCGLLLRSPSAVKWLSARRSLLSLLSIALMVVLYTHMCTWQTVYPTEPWSQTVSTLVNVLCHSGSPLHALTFVTFLLALILRAPIFVPAVWVLNSSIVRSLAVYSHGLHFFHFGALYLSLEIIDGLQLVDVFKSDGTYYTSLSAFYALVLMISFLLAAIYSHIFEPAVFFLFRWLISVFDNRRKKDKKLR